jgi:hypothetical protein
MGRISRHIVLLVSAIRFLNRYPYREAAALGYAPFQTASYAMTADEPPPQEVRSMMIDLESGGEWKSEDIQKAGVKRHLRNKHRRPRPS